MRIITLIRHGQASFGQANYDALSAQGRLQATALGQYLAQVGADLSHVVSGDLVRQQDTADLMLSAYQAHQHNAKIGSAINDAVTEDIDCKKTLQTNAAAPAVERATDARFNEFLHEDILACSRPNLATKEGLMAELAGAAVPSEHLATLFDEALTKWYSEGSDNQKQASVIQHQKTVYQEPWQAFHQRVNSALQDWVASLLASPHQRLWIITSGGVISTLSAHILSHTESQGNCCATTARAFNRCTVNTGMTDILVQEDGTLQLLSFNAHPHLILMGLSSITSGRSSIDTGPIQANQLIQTSQPIVTWR